MTISRCCVALAYLRATVTEVALPEYLEKLPSNHSAYADKHASATQFALGAAEKGGLKKFEVVRFTKDKHLYRVFGSSNTGCGYWWALDLSESWAEHKHHNAICPEWNTGTYVKICTVKVGFIAVVGIGQTAKCAAGNVIVPPENRLQLNRGSDSVCGDESMCYTCDSNVSDLSGSSCISPGKVVYALPDYLEALPESHEAYTEKISSTHKFAMGLPNQGNFKSFQVVRFTNDRHVYRMFGSGSGCGFWWALNLSESWSAYQHDNAICPEWNDGTKIKRCKVKAGFITVIGIGQTVRCAAGDMLVPPDNHFQMNRGGDSVCDVSSFCVTCDADQSDLRASSCLAAKGPGSANAAMTSTAIVSSLSVVVSLMI